MQFISKTSPYEFWLACMIMLFGLGVLFLYLWAIRSIDGRRPEDVSPSLIVIFVITGSLLLITVGYSTEQIAPAFGLFGTIIGYMLGRMSQPNALGPPPPGPPDANAVESTSTGGVSETCGSMKMRRRLELLILSLFYIIVASGAADGATAGGLQLRSVDMLPPQLPDANSIVITNFGNSALRASYSDGGAARKNFQVSPNQVFNIRCETQNCNANVQFAYHDGAQVQTTSLQRGTVYAFYWDASTSRWSIGPFDVVRKSISQ
jgi:hypothetical protein